MRERPLSLALHDLQSAGKTSKSLLADVQSVGKTSFLDFARFLKYILCLFHLVCLLYG